MGMAEPFASGCEHCTWLMGGCVVLDGSAPHLLPSGAPDARLMLFPAASVRILDTWTVAGLREAGWLAATETTGQSFGGDLEAVTVHSGLLAARHVAGADVAVVAQGPGNLGTGTRWGFSGVAAGEAVNAAAVLGGRPVASLRLSDADSRSRHQGVSHHSITAYGRVALAACDVAVPELPEPLASRVAADVATTGRRSDDEMGDRSLDLCGWRRVARIVSR